MTPESIAIGAVVAVCFVATIGCCLTMSMTANSRDAILDRIDKLEARITKDQP